MATPSRVEGDMHVNGGLSATSITYPDGTITNTAVAANAGIAATKVTAHKTLYHSQEAGTDVTSMSKPIHTVYGATATLIAVDVVPIQEPTGGDKQYTVDLQKGNAATSFATVLSSVITVNSSSNDRTIQAGTLSSTSLVDGDSLQVVITASGSTGSQGQGVLVTVTIHEAPQ